MNQDGTVGQVGDEGLDCDIARGDFIVQPTHEGQISRYISTSVVQPTIS